MVLNREFGAASYLRQLVLQEDQIAAASATHGGGSVEEYPNKRRLWYKTDPTRPGLHTSSIMDDACVSDVVSGWMALREARLLLGQYYCSQRPKSQLYRSARGES